MDAHDVLVQINDILMTGGLDSFDIVARIDEIVCEYFIQLREELEEEDD